MSFAATGFRDDAISDDRPDRIHRREHHVPIAPGRSLHVTETFSTRALRRSDPRRALVMLPGPLFQGSFFNVDVPGYDAGVVLARRGFFVYAVDFEGTGTSTYPTRGTAVTVQRQVEAVQEVVGFVRRYRDVPRVDLLGESWGGGIAAHVAADASAVRSCILASMIYRTPGPAAQAQYQSTEWRSFLHAQPNGYLQTSVSFYAQAIASLPPAVRAWVEATQPSRYPIQPLLDFFGLPFFDPHVARVPGLIIKGEDDPGSLFADIQQLAADYGEHGATDITTITAGGHIPRAQAAPYSSQYWAAVLKFIDS